VGIAMAVFEVPELPDARIGFVDGCFDLIQNKGCPILCQRKVLMSEPVVCKEGEQGNQRLTVDVVLNMFISLITDPYRLISQIALKVVEGLLFELVLAKDSI